MLRIVPQKIKTITIIGSKGEMGTLLQTLKSKYLSNKRNFNSIPRLCVFFSAGKRKEHPLKQSKQTIHFN